MRTTLKIVLPLIISVAAISLLFAGYQVRTERRILRNEEDARDAVQEAFLAAFKQIGHFQGLSRLGT